MMKSVMLVSLACFLALLVQARGFRLEQGFMSLSNQKNEEGKNKLLISEVEAGGAGASAGVKEEVECSEKEHCSSSGRNRKLTVMTVPSTTSTTTSTATVQKTEKNGERIVDSKEQPTNETPKLKKENFSLESSPVSEHQDAGADQYPDILDIAGMDYSSAKRKPPIHN